MKFFDAMTGPDSGIVFGTGGTDYAPYLSVTVSSIPIPGAVWLLGSGLIGIVGIRRKYKK